MNRERNIPSERKGIDRKGSDQEYFHPTGRKGNERREFETSLPRRVQGQGGNFQKEGYGGGAYIQKNGQQVPNNRNGQQDGKEMPDMVKQYLLKTLMGDGNRRY